eukprot:scaffold108060_cov48-Phaeocystis_antarctica.AAC.1
MARATRCAGCSARRRIASRVEARGVACAASEGRAASCAPASATCSSTSCVKEVLGLGSGLGSGLGLGLGL